MITALQAINSLEETIGQEPDYVYNPGGAEGTRACTYAEYRPEPKIERHVTFCGCDDCQAEDNCDAVGPSCAVGQGIYHLGVLDVAGLSALDGCGGISDIQHAIKENLGTVPTALSMSDAAATIYSVAQINQDAGKSWGVALSLAKAEYERLLVLYGENIDTVDFVDWG